MTQENIKVQMVKAREEYINLIKAELLGPGSEFSIPDAEHELISSLPTSRYSIGILYPQHCMNQDNAETIEININNADEENQEESISIDEDLGISVDKEVDKEIDTNKGECFSEISEQNLDEEISMASQYRQSSIGITFIADGAVDIVNCKLSFATYRKALIQDCVIPYKYINIPPELSHKIEYDSSMEVIRLKSQIDYKEIKRIFEQDTIPENEAKELKKITYRFIDFIKNGYVRVPHEFPCICLKFENKNYIEYEENPQLKELGVKLSALRTKLKDGTFSITIMLVNGKEDNTGKAYNCLFQPKLLVDSKSNDFVFVENNHNMDFDSMDEEEKILELLYRNKKNYAIGMGTSTDWKIDENGIGKLWNDFFSQIEVPSMNFSLPDNKLITNEELSMKYFSDLNKISKAKKIKSLTNLVNLYKNWIDNLQITAKKLDPKYKSVVANNINECTYVCNRMYEGIKILEEREEVFSAFSLANRAMFMQRVHLKMQSNMANIDRYPDDEEISNWLCEIDYINESDKNAIWRPFQIAFILMDIVSIVEKNSKDRDIVDLIWFPTGGGKTEAYLGLTAFTIFYEKLSDLENSNGTTVIMRYTLRLLASQQFTRAATLICACECIRRDCLNKKSRYPVYSLGKVPITIGLWTGGSHIPNKNTGDNSAKYYLKKLTESKRESIKWNKDRYNKFQVLKCPWCGTKLVKDYKNKKEYGTWGYNLENGKHFYMFCPHEDCEFTDRLPIQIIDEELYDNPPTLLFGTVDKFAILPWEGKIGSFFATNSNNRCPELIIQDELHLISGALGTMVGLYETAIDALCSSKGIRPKIIASTATIRRAKEQCSILYNRNVVQFPPAGLNAEDSFFAKEMKIDLNEGLYGRRYIGIQPSGKTKAMMEIRLFSALLQNMYSIDLPDNIKDKYWTLTAYYNSLKDLGKASTMADDDVKDFIVRIANRHFEQRRLIIGTDELTSRISTTELNETLDKLEKIEYSKENIEKKRYASNVLLATNMISVGIDIARLNVMLIIGQPKLTSEYIQASSRVGRSFPGVVLVQYDATKSRDRSHYESFKSYHESFYKYVEPTGATPFSKPARDRALHAVLTALLRNKVKLDNDKSAIKFSKEELIAKIDEIENFIINRVKDINNRANISLKDNSEEIKIEIEQFFDYWQQLVDECNEEEIELYFGKKFMVNSPKDKERRLLKQFNLECNDDAKETMTSMRNVDSSVEGSILIWED